MTPEPVFAVESMGKSFRGRRVLSMGSCWVHPCRVTALVGRNGCGKSTLLRCGLGLLRGSHGVVRLGSRRTTRPALAAFAREGVFFWPDHALLPYGPTVQEVFDLLAHHVPGARVEKAMAVCGIEHLGRHRTHQLSGGERRRTELAFVVARRPTVLLADEPFLGVMPHDRQLFIDQLRDLGQDGAGILITGHEVDTMFDLADDVIWMTAGTTHYLGTPAEAAGNDQFRREYLGLRTAAGPRG